MRRRTTPITQALQTFTFGCTCTRPIFFFSHLPQNKSGVSLQTSIATFLLPNQSIFFFFFRPSPQLSPSSKALHHSPGKPLPTTSANSSYRRANIHPGAPSQGSSLQWCWHDSLQTTFFLAILVTGDYCSQAGVGMSHQSQAGRSTVVTRGPGKAGVAASRSTKPSCPLTELAWRLLGTLFLNETGFKCKCPFLPSFSWILGYSLILNGK